MTDKLTTAIRRAVAELVDAAPLAPDLNRPRSSRPSHRRSLAVVGLAVAAAAAGVLAVRDEPPRHSTVVSGQPEASTPPEGASFVAPTQLPAGLTFVEGGRRAFRGTGGETLLMAAEDGREARLTWSEVAVQGGCPRATPVTTIRGDPQSGQGGLLIASRPEEAAFRGNEAFGQLIWCGDGFHVTLVTDGFGEAATRALAATVRVQPGLHRALTVDAPAGFASGRVEGDGIRYALVFEAPAGTRLRVLVRPGWTDDPRLAKAETGATGATDVEVRGRPGWLEQRIGAVGLTVLYDDHTVVSLYGEGLTGDQLVEAAASLQPADPSIAPDLAGDPGRCDRLGLCG